MDRVTGSAAEGREMERVRVGFIGAGGMANHVHYPSVAEDPRAEIAAICDLDEVRLNRTADKYGVAARYTDYRRMLEREPLDAVYVIMPPMPLHPIVTDCLTAQKHVLTEKPPGLRATKPTIRRQRAPTRRR